MNTLNNYFDEFASAVCRESSAKQLAAKEKLSHCAGVMIESMLLLGSIFCISRSKSLDRLEATLGRIFAKMHV